MSDDTGAYIFVCPWCSTGLPIERIIDIDERSSLRTSIDADPSLDEDDKIALQALLRIAYTVRDTDRAQGRS